MSIHRREHCKPSSHVLSFTLLSPYLFFSFFSLLQKCVAGDRVITDPLCKPFSMGRYRNLSFDNGMILDGVKCNMSNLV